MKYLVDTNALIYAAQKKEDLDNVVDGKILIPNLVLSELKKIARTAKKKKYRKSAKLALQIVKHKKWKIINLKKGHPDKRMLDYAKKNGCKIYSFDKKLNKNERKL